MVSPGEDEVGIFESFLDCSGPLGVLSQETADGPHCVGLVLQITVYQKTQTKDERPVLLQIDKVKHEGGRNRDVTAIKKIYS